MTLKRTEIRQAAEEAIRTAVDGVSAVEADSGYPVDQVPMIRVGWTEEAPQEMHMDTGSTVYVLGLMVEVYLAIGPSALDACDGLQELVDGAVAGLAGDADLGVVQVLPPTSTVTQDGGGEQNHVHLEIEYPVQYLRD